MKALLSVILVAAVGAGGLFSLALGILGWIDGGEMTINLLPVGAESAPLMMVGIGLVSLVAAWLAATGGGLRALPVLVVTAALVASVVATVFRSDYRFEGTGGLTRHGLLLLGVLVLSGLALWRVRSGARDRTHN